MKLAFYSVDKLKKEILAIVGKRADIKKYKLFFFGSRISGTGTERSDIDIGIEGPKPISPETIFEIKEEVEKLDTLYKIDIVDFKAASEDFRRVAMQNMEFITSPI